jgi:hypothetical protein
MHPKPEHAHNVLERPTHPPKPPHTKIDGNMQQHPLGITTMQKLDKAHSKPGNMHRQQLNPQVGNLQSNSGEG